MEIETNDYKIWLDSESSTVFFRGFLRLDGMEEYQPVMDLLLSAIKKVPNLNLNLRELEFLNSSGISTLSMFIVNVREQGNVQMVLQGSDKILWQTRSLRNLQRLMPSLQLEFA